MTNSIFRYSAKDTYLILYTLILCPVPFLLIFWQVNFWALLLFWPIHAWLITNLQNSPLHHHSHWPTFHNKKLNSAYELLLSMVGGIPHQFWRRNHLKHHVYVNDKPVDGKTQDPVSVFAKGTNGEVQNFWKFCFTTMIVAFKNMVIFPKVPVQDSKPKMVAEVLLHDLYFLAVFIVDYRYGLYLLLVYIVAHFLNGATSFGEHWTVLDRRGDTTQDSIGIYSKWYNIVGFGAGYHQEHHHRPNIHWTQLPNLTPRMHPDRVVKHSMHIFNNPYWQHFKLLFQKPNQSLKDF